MCESFMEEIFMGALFSQMRSIHETFVLSEYVFADVMKIYFLQEFIILNSVKIRFVGVFLQVMSSKQIYKR